ncbi:hypothetical protein CkaCkLH20_09594 [Colletotrichum karsti]|uniref:Alanine racemase N-terminal domain-containing protein n=1 Tax=Colletotrichum karsti TaxID=1095194 RepID=A0A9P6HZ44_9PEZI|nr:uncharacterized protein CkaCkLH20_09594 [Colletotrichum karsti]KAF9873084.1 hypothetical protein CkaCkLH20_09594 [Colletotrichum karsti]
MAIPQRPRPDLEELRQFYVGKDVRTVPKPAVVLDSAKIRRHCQSMLDAVKALGVDFRAHVKTHKTEQIARLQVGDKTQDANFIVSTVSEIEHLLPTLKALQQDSRHTNVLYGVPLLSSQVSRLANLNRELGPGSISVMIDHPSHIESLMRLYQLSKLPVGVFLKIDTGYHRAGLPVSFLDKDGLLDKLNQLEDENKARLVGIYSHSSLSYQDSSADQAMNNLAAEIEGCIEAFNAHEKLHFSRREMVISVGASPQVTSVENLTTGFYSPSSN